MLLSFFIFILLVYINTMGFAFILIANKALIKGSISISVNLPPMCDFISIRRLQALGTYFELCAQYKL